MSKIDEEVIENVEKLVKKVGLLTDKFEERLRDYAQAESDRKRIRELEEEVARLTGTIKSAEYRTSMNVVADLEAREAKLKTSLKLEYDKGYAEAYIAVTSRMKS